MRDFTRQGVAPDPNWPLAPNPNWLRTSNAPRLIEPELVFQLTRKLQDGSATPAFSESPTNPLEQWRSPRPSAFEELPVDTTELDQSEPIDDGEPVKVPITRRQIAVRCFGALAIAAAIAGSGLILRTPGALRQAVDWATLGHADAVLPSTP
jgi:hypothetical protein